VEVCFCTWGIVLGINHDTVQSQSLGETVIHEILENQWGWRGTEKDAMLLPCVLKTGVGDNFDGKFQDRGSVETFVPEEATMVGSLGGRWRDSEGG